MVSSRDHPGIGTRLDEMQPAMNGSLSVKSFTPPLRAIGSVLRHPLVLARMLG
jgi:hypothetical protein